MIDSFEDTSALESESKGFYYSQRMGREKIYAYNTDALIEKKKEKSKQIN